MSPDVSGRGYEVNQIMFKRILVPLDGSQPGEQAIPYAIEMAKRFDAEVALLRVAPITRLTSAELSGQGNPLETELLISQARRRDKLRETKAGQYIQGKLGEIQAQGVSGSSQIAAGDPSKAILDFCRKENIDLVVMTTSGKGGIRRALVGSVADTLIRETRIPVLVVRPGKN